VADIFIRPTKTETQRTELKGTPVVSIASHDRFRPAPVTIDDIYHSPESVGSPYLSTALRLMSTALKDIDSAIELLGEGDRIGSDDSMQHYQVLLPELFACRSIGEGFGLIVSSLQNAVRSLHGQPLDERQIRSVRSVIVALRSEPFMSFDAALAYVSRLEQANLSVDPPNFEYLADLLSE